MAFHITKNVHVERDKDGLVRHLRHQQESYTPDSAGLRSPTPLALASSYIRDVAEIFNIKPEALAVLDVQPPQDLFYAQNWTDQAMLLQFAGQKSIMESKTISYVQTSAGLPVWEGGFSINLQENPLRITNSVSTLHVDIEPILPDPNAPYLPNKMTESELIDLLGLKQKKDRKELKINGTRLLIYRYDPELRFDPESTDQQKSGDRCGGPPILPLPPVPDEIGAFKHYMVTEVLFTVGIGTESPLNWRAFIEPKTGSVLYLRAFVAYVRGMVYRTDPIDQTGDVTVNATSSEATLNTYRTSETLEGLTAPASGDPQELTGEFVELREIEGPVDTPPTESVGTDFNYGAKSLNFAAVNAYYHVDWMFRLVQNMGFDTEDYFDGTTFPVPVDHWGLGGAVNARCEGNATGTGVGRFLFGRCVSGQQVGISTEARTVMHEFGHAVLWDSIHSANFGFAHSPGDSFATILSDPESNLTGLDRFIVFNWCPLNTDRRCDRAVSGGWAWGGTRDTGGYSSEEILVTTLFRIYQSAGGDSDRLASRQWAARYVVYLILRGIGSLATSPVTPTVTPDVFATVLMAANQGSWDFEGQRGGGLWKVIRWSFEKQGLYKILPHGSENEEGDPDPVDVYIDDGRHGEYEYQRIFYQTTDIWNRHSSDDDGGGEHLTPYLGVSNYAFARVKNRGSEPAENVTVRGYHTRPSAGIVWPDDWQPMVTAEISLTDSIPAGGEVVVGPFEWIPNNEGHECMLMEVNADGDMSNINPLTFFPCASGPVPDSRFVPFDNNIGQRNVAPVPGGGRSAALLDSFEGRPFWVNNPFVHLAHMEVEAELPEFLTQRGWKVRFTNPGGGKFTLGPRDSRKIEIRLEAGGDFSPKDVTPNTAIRILAYADQQFIGGMTYAIDPKLKVKPAEHPTCPGKADCSDVAKNLLDCLDVPADKVKSVRIKRITIDIDLAEDC